MANPVTLQQGIQETILSVTGTGSQKGVGYALPSSQNAPQGRTITWQSLPVGPPASISVSIQISLGTDTDGEYVTLDTSTATGGEARTVNNVNARWLRANQTARPDGTSETVKILIT